MNLTAPKKNRPPMIRHQTSKALRESGRPDGSRTNNEKQGGRSEVPAISAAEHLGDQLVDVLAVLAIG